MSYVPSFASESPHEHAMRREQIRQSNALDEISASLKAIARHLANMSVRNETNMAASAPPASILHPPGGKPIV
jgi:hypothetical protein